MERAIAYSYGQKTEKEKKDHIRDVQDDIFEILASYGHTLRLKPQECIVVNVDLGQQLFYWSSQKTAPSHLILQLRKKDLDDFNNDILSMSDLRKKLISQTY